MGASVEIEPVRRVTAELVEALRRLVAHLSVAGPELTPAVLEEIVACPSNTLLVARHEHDREIVGTATVVFVVIPSGRRARLESVVVDPRARGAGVGEALCRRAIRVATERGASALDLTSAPSRAAANRLYERVGFARRETNVYRLKLPIAIDSATLAPPAAFTPHE